MSYESVRIIRPVRERRLVEDLADLWHARGLLAVLARREIAVRYRQAAVGFLWVFLQPIVGTILFTVVFVFIAKIPSQEVPYPVFAFSGLVAWQYFNRVILEGSQSLVNNAALISKVYFPRLIIPLTVPAAASVDSILSTATLIVFAWLFNADIKWTVIFVPFVLLAIALFASSLSLWLATVNAIYRDIGFGLPMVMQVLMYLSPVVYPANLVPESVRWLYRLNPIAVLVDSMRWALLGTTPPSLAGICLLVGLTIAFFWGGLLIFRRMEGILIDRI